MEQINNPIVIQRADPFVFKESGTYYFTGSYPKYDRIVLRKASSLNELNEAKEHVVWTKDLDGEKSALIWAPEIHKINDKWYIYYAAAPNDCIEDDTFNHRMFVLENSNDDPLTDNWIDKGKIDTGWETFSLDATVFELNGRLYYVWAQQDIEIPGHSNIYISEMENPWTLKGSPTMLTIPEYDWECKGFWVNEGPAILIKEQRIFLTYSASATGIDYCMGMLVASVDSNLLDVNAWNKVEEPVFTSAIENGQYGPGHNSFTKSKDDLHDVLVYHARNYTEIEGDPLYDPNRHARAQFIEWYNGWPDFGSPVRDTRLTPHSTKVIGSDAID
ncbi:family 43 glycosylhydrolase [Staphylococcus gallinarum]|uniref:glycoside hydrolase family 43 protein n=1 Tax=Staphylococcus gallinarum TaxID=1293 RepID=UPI00227EF89F|nr:family 43 glycosylhydrolase [Staphylococcus gallinarum]MDN6413894.1 family 43 glycosylhydrolase [Staphylococcus gallinarum]